MKIKLIACEIFFREVCAVASRSINQIDVEFLPKRLHDIGAEGMSSNLQQAIDRVDENLYDAIALAYGLCNNGIVGLQANTLSITVPRAHDCITMFLGNKERYQQYFENNPGTYFKTSGWIERGESEGQWSQLSLQGMGASYEELVEKYGEDNARYLKDTIGDLTPHYAKCAFIEMGVEPDDRFQKQAQQDAKEKDWQFETLQGDLSLLQRLVDGQWNENEFLITPPGKRIAPCYNESIIQLEEPQP
ncbi:MAG: DUF1638 domain-containing protein [Candidatus Hinthialibacter antarcticus]|nr:DUF1638 domain-containing protein [Candidatus Hinthialibacter antarcticus]